jgi:hypothetical protein
VRERPHVSASRGKKAFWGADPQSTLQAEKRPDAFLKRILYVDAQGIEVETPQPWQRYGEELERPNAIENGIWTAGNTACFPYGKRGFLRVRNCVAIL